jgi:hypothetical protein
VVDLPSRYAACDYPYDRIGCWMSARNKYPGLTEDHLTVPQ